MLATGDVCIEYEVAELEESLCTALCDVIAKAELDDPIFTADNKDLLANDDVCFVFAVEELEEGLATADCDVMAGAQVFWTPTLRTISLLMQGKVIIIWKISELIMYSQTPLYEHPPNTDTSLLQTMLCPWKKKALFYGL